MERGPGRMPSKTGPGLRSAGVLAPVDPTAWLLSTLPRGLSICSATVALGFMVCSKRMQLAAAERLSKQGSGAELSDLVFLAIWFFLQF